MTSLRTRSTLLAISLSLLLSAPGNAAQAGMVMPPAEATVSDEVAVQPEAVAALRRMSQFLMSLNSAEVTSRGSLDVVTGENQRVQQDALTKYKLRKSGFVIDYDSDMKKRRFMYDGKQFTVYAPSTGYYATVPAPATTREVLSEVYKRYGIALPLEDLFRWSDPNSTREGDLKRAYQIGTATLDGIRTDHYVFREEFIDWELWIEQGATPLPRKLVIVDRTVPMGPTFIARLDWKLNPPLADSDFTFVPGSDAKRIELAAYEGE